METNFLKKGGNIVLPDGVEVCVGLSWEAPNGGFDLDAWTFMLGANGRVLSDEHFIFFNNMASPCQTVFVSEDNQQGGSENEDDEMVTVRLPYLPAEVDKVVFVVNIHEGAQKGQNFGHLDNASIRLFIPGTNQELTRYNLGLGDASTETSLIFGELYRNKGGWKFRAIAQGSMTGPAALAQNYGVNVPDDPPLPAAPAPLAPPPPPPPPTINLAKGQVNLTKSDESVVMQVTPAMDFSLYWTDPYKDLGLIVLVTRRNGTQESYDWRRLHDHLGEITHHGDRLRGGGDVREYATISLRPDTDIAAIAIAAYSEVSNGIGSFRSMGAHALIDDGYGTQVMADLNKGGTFSYHTVIVTILVNPDNTITVNRVSRFSASGSENRPALMADGTLKMNAGEVVFK